MKFSRVSACLTKSGDPQRWPAFCSVSSRVSLIILSLILILGATTKLVAQSSTSGDIVGVVTDPSGAVLANASVTLKSQENGSTQAAIHKLSRCVSVLAVAARTLHRFRHCRRLS